MAEPDHFLGVASSLAGQPWRDRLTDNRAALTIAEKANVPEVLARVLAGRGVVAEDVDSYMNPTLRQLMPAPGDLRDLKKGAERIAGAIRTGEAIGIIGDYDVDGMTSTAMLCQYLAQAGATPEVHIPHRVAEGLRPQPSGRRGTASKGRQAVDYARLRGDGARPAGPRRRALL